MTDTTVTATPSMATRRSARAHSFSTHWMIYAVLILAAVISLIPFAWMVMTSLKDLGDVIALNFWPWFPFGSSAVQWNNYPDAINLVGIDSQSGLPMFIRQFLNTALVTAVIIVGVTITSVMAAYAFAQLRFPGKGLLFVLVLSTLMIPDDLTLVPRAVMMYKNYLNWYNTYFALTVPFLASAFGIFLIRQFFLQIPRDLFDAARIDGSGHIRYMVMIMIPLTRPAILTVALFNFIWTWNEFKWAQLVTQDNNMSMISLGLQNFLKSEGGTELHLAMALAALVVAPILVLYLFTQRYFTEGITTTGLKG